MNVRNIHDGNSSGGMIDDFEMDNQIMIFV